MCVLLTIFALEFSQNGKAQDVLNGYDSTGRKHGRWIVYLNERGNEIKDSSSARFFKYTCYHHGQNLYPMGGFIKKGGVIQFSDALVKTSLNAVLLNGELTCLDKKSRKRFTHVFNHGAYVDYKEFYSTGQLKVHFDYTRLWKGQPNTWRYAEYGKEGKVTVIGYFRKGPRGWMIYSCSPNE